MTAPHVGNTGVNDEDDESAPDLGRRLRRARPRARARRTGARGARSTTSCVDQGVVGICGVDTRALTRHLRERGAMRVGIFSGATPPTPASAARAGARSRRRWPAPTWPARSPPPRPYVVPGGRRDRRFTVAALDLGIKAHDPAADGRARHRGARAARHRDARRRAAPSAPDGVFFSNGPGDPATADAPGRAAARRCSSAGSRYFGICFGNQLLGRALGFGTYKLQVRPPRHQPAGAWTAPPARSRSPRTTTASPSTRRSTRGDRARRTARADGHATSASTTTSSRASSCAATGCRRFSVQYHPEAAAGPHDAATSSTGSST